MFVDGYQLFSDGGYSWADAHGSLASLVERGAIPAGLVAHSIHGTWGFLYWSKTCLHESHRINPHSWLANVLPGRG